MRADPAERFAERCGGVLPNGCRAWVGQVNNEGYGVFYLGLGSDGRRRHIGAHRVAWFLATGRWPSDGLLLDHQCHNLDPTCAGGRTCLHRQCVEFTHLREVTNHVNVAAGASGRPWAVTPAADLPPILNHSGHGSETHCSYGHPFNEANTYLSPRRRMRLCRVCHREKERLRRTAVREGRPVGFIFDFSAGVWTDELAARDPFDLFNGR